MTTHQNSAGLPDSVSLSIQLLMDEREITRLLLALARLVDQKDFDGLAELYAVNGRLVTPRGTHSGRAGLADYVTRDIGHYHALHHVSAGHEIDVHPGRATASARMTLLATHVNDAATMEFATVGGFYDVDLVHEEGHWRLAEVRINPQWRFHSPGEAKAGSDWLPD